MKKLTPIEKQLARAMAFALNGGIVDYFDTCDYIEKLGKFRYSSELGVRYLSHRDLLKMLNGYFRRQANEIIKDYCKEY